MKNNVLLVGINSKYIHSNLAVRYLESYCRKEFDNIRISEFSINDRIDNVLRELYLDIANVYAFSCYIWNIELVHKICSSLKKAKPEAIIVLGGPEVSYDAAATLTDSSYIDYIICGEGEVAFLELLKYLEGYSTDISDIDGLYWRNGNEVRANKPRSQLSVLDELPFPYYDLADMKNKIVYYETSRGCPFNCQYCLSSTIHGVRFLTMDRVKQDIYRFTQAKVKQVKLVDRTFNCNIDRSVEIMNYIVSLNTKTNFHFEISADLLNEAFFESVRSAPKGLFQFEIGVQSTNSDTLDEIQRKTDFEKLKKNVLELLKIGNSHIHLDLIAGLPYEDFESFKNSFNDVHALMPHMLQLGFLKLLKGSGLRNNAIRYGIEYNDFPPYEVIKTSSISYYELIKLKRLEDVMEIYYNSGRFQKTLKLLFSSLDFTPFDFYALLSDFWYGQGYYKGSRSVNEHYVILYNFVKNLIGTDIDLSIFDIFNEILKLDWLTSYRNGGMPSVLKRYNHSKVKEVLHDYIRNNLNSCGVFSEFSGMPMKEALKYISYEVFFINIFDEAYPVGDTIAFFIADPHNSKEVSIYFSMPLSEITGCCK